MPELLNALDAPEAVLERLRAYGERWNDGRNDGTLLKFENGHRFFLADAVSPAPSSEGSEKAVGEEPACNISGECEAPAGAKRITSCIYCGSELHEIAPGKWRNWYNCEPFTPALSQPEQQGGGAVDAEAHARAEAEGEVDDMRRKVAFVRRFVEKGLNIQGADPTANKVADEGFRACLEYISWLETGLAISRAYWAANPVSERAALTPVSDPKDLEAELREAREVLALCDGEGKRAKAITAPEDAAVEQLCKRHGYGAVMDAAARLWFKLDPVGAQTVGPCAVTVRETLALLDKKGGEE